MKKLLPLLAASCLVVSTVPAPAETDALGDLIVHRGQTVIVQRLALLFHLKSDLDRYVELYELGSDNLQQQSEAMERELLTSHKAWRAQTYFSAAVVDQGKDGLGIEDEVAIQVAGERPLWVHVSYLEEYILENRINHLKRSEQ